MIGVQVFGDCHRIDFDFPLDPAKQDKSKTVVGVEEVLHIGRYYIALSLAERFDKMTVLEDVVKIFDSTSQIDFGEKTTYRCPNGCGTVHQVCPTRRICWHCGWVWDRNAGFLHS